MRKQRSKAGCTAPVLTAAILSLSTQYLAFWQAITNQMQQAYASTHVQPHVQTPMQNHMG
jgi:hypothetical protein